MFLANLSRRQAASSYQRLASAYPTSNRGSHAEAARFLAGTLPKGDRGTLQRHLQVIDQILGRLQPDR